MTLYTKSIKAEPSKDDGYRICIMRNPGGYENKYDEWMPDLSPSQQLREKVKNGRGWGYFKQAFYSELETRQPALDYVAKRAKEGEITLLCVEDNPAFCHRSLVAEHIKARHSDLSIIVK